MVTVAPRDRLNARGLPLRAVSLVHHEITPGDSLPVEVKIRYRHPAVPATLQMLANSRARVEFAASFPAVTPARPALL